LLTKMATMQTMISEHDEAVNLASVIHQLLNSNGGAWTGTARQLCDALGLDILPRVLSVWLRNGELDGVVHVTFKKKRGVHLITLSLAPAAAPERSEDHSPEDVSGCSKKVAEIEDEVSFPFCWQYAEITELSEQQKADVNRPLGAGGHQHFRHCSTCGSGGPGIIEFVKVSNGYTSYHCHECASDYARTAQQLEGSWGH